MEDNKRQTGIIFLVIGVTSICAYLLIARTTVGQISELYGLGFLFTFLGVLALVGHVMGVAPEGDR
jgi:hypothetical protein